MVWPHIQTRCCGIFLRPQLQLSVVIPGGLFQYSWSQMTERPRLPRAVMDRSSRPGPEPTTLEAVGDQWCYALVVVQAGDDDEDDDEDEL